MMPDNPHDPDELHRADKDAYTHMAMEHHCAMNQCRQEMRRSPRFSPARERHFVARLEWFTCINRMLELSLPGIIFNLGEKLEHYDHARLRI